MHIDIENGLDEKLSSSLLEEITSKSQFLCIFTVVQNPFMGLECTEHTEFDAIFIMNDVKCTLKAYDFLRIIRNIGMMTPLILLHDQDFRPDMSNEPGLPASGFNAPNTTSTLLKFSNTLKKPFTCRDICLLIDQMFYFHFLSNTNTPSMSVVSNSQPSSEKRQCKISRHTGKNDGELSNLSNTGNVNNAFATLPVFPNACPPPPAFTAPRNIDVSSNSNITTMQPVSPQEQVAFFDYYQQPILSFSHSGSINNHVLWNSGAMNSGAMQGMTLSGMSAGLALTGTATAFTNGAMTGLDGGMLQNTMTTTTASAINAVMEYEAGELDNHPQSGKYTYQRNPLSTMCNNTKGGGGMTTSEEDSSDSCNESKSMRKPDMIAANSQTTTTMYRHSHHSLLNMMNITDVQYV